MAKRTPFRRWIEFTAAVNTTHASKHVRIPGKHGVVREVRIYMYEGNVGMATDVVFADNTDTDLTDFDNIDPMETILFTTGNTYVGATNPPGPKNTPEVADAEIVLGDNAVFDAKDQADHRLAIRTTGVTGAYKVKVLLIGEVWRN